MRNVSRNLALALLVFTAVFAPGCLRVGDPSPDELTARDAWAKMVADDDRAQIMREANTHTEWLEKRKVQWETLQFKAKFNHAQSKKAATRAATNPAATQPMMRGL